MGLDMLYMVGKNFLYMVCFVIVYNEWAHEKFRGKTTFPQILQAHVTLLIEENTDCLEYVHTVKLF